VNNVHPFQSRSDIRAEAREWVLRFNGDTEPTGEDISALRKWAARSTVHRLELERATNFWCDADLLSALAVPLGGNSNRETPGFKSRLLSLSPFYKLPGIVIATLLLGVVTLISFWSLQSPENIKNGVYSTVVGKQEVLTLPDGSQVQLDTNSQVRVDYSEGSREIHLVQGKAHFDVAKDLDRPFEVYAGDSLVRAIGTAFSVYIDDQAVKVTVDDGKVNLLRAQQRSSAQAVAFPDRGGALRYEDSDEQISNDKVLVSLKKGQSALFNEDMREVRELSEKDLSRELAWRKGLLIFAGDPLSQVISEVNRYTDINIEILDPELADLQIGGRFRIGELDALFDVLEAGFGVQISYRDKDHVQLRSSFN